MPLIRRFPRGVPIDLDEERRFRREAYQRRRTLFRLTLAAIVALSTGIIGFVLKNNYSWVRNAARDQAAEASGGRRARRGDAAVDLVLSEVAFQGPPGKRHLEGALHSSAKYGYRNVEISLVVRDAHGAGLGYANSTLPSVRAQGTAPFATNTVPDGAVRFELYSISGTPEGE